MELTSSLLSLRPLFVPVFTTLTFTTFVQIVTGWVFSQRHLFITEIIFSGGHSDRPSCKMANRSCGLKSAQGVSTSI